MNTTLRIETKICYYCIFLTRVYCVPVPLQAVDDIVEFGHFLLDPDEPQVLRVRHSHPVELHRQTSLAHKRWIHCVIV